MRTIPESSVVWVLLLFLLLAAVWDFFLRRVPNVLVLLFLLVACLRLLRQPLKLALRVLINSALGFCALWLLNLTTAVTGMSLGLNLFNALTIGVLGVPGLGLLLLLKWVLV